MAPPTETLVRSDLTPELFELNVNSRLGFFWLARRLLRIPQFLFRVISSTLAIIFGRYEMVREIGPGLAPARVPSPISEFEHYLR